MIGYAKKIEKIVWESAFDKKKKKPGLKFNPRLALTSVWTTGPRATRTCTCMLKNNGRHITRRYCKWCKLINKYAQFYNIHPDAQLVTNLNWLIHVRVPNNLLPVMVITQLTQNKQLFEALYRHNYYNNRVVSTNLVFHQPGDTKLDESKCILLPPQHLSTANMNLIFDKAGCL